MAKSTVLLLLLISRLSLAQGDLNFYLPEGAYDSRVPTPESVLGHQVGEFHVTHDKLVYYMQALAAASDRITIRETGRTFEKRPQVILTITSPANHTNIGDIREKHLAMDNSASAPVVIYMGFSIHGNEPSGANASMLTAYYLAASQDPALIARLENAVILLDPSFNPDGLQRFSTWANSFKSQLSSPDPNDLEHQESWPRGRTNHYWFDLNRDWLPAQLPESQARLAVFHEWKPNVLTDHHEMGTNSTFFFQPGIPSRNNPLTPQNNFELTARIGEYHAAALDSIGSLYYTKESFDDFFYGKGSTYPDINGGIGILFEQASSRGHAQESVNGILTFPFTIKNQFNTSLSTLKAAVELRQELLDMQREFYSSAIGLAEESSVKGYIVASNDPWRVYRFGEMLERHKINFEQSGSAQTVNGKQFSTSLVIPAGQPQHRLITTLFEKRTSFTDSLFYDISAWHMPSAFGLEYATLDSRRLASFGPAAEFSAPAGGIRGGQSAYAYAIDWKSYYAPAVLYALLDAGLHVKVTTEPFTGSNGIKYSYGTLVLPAKNQDKTPEQIFTLLQEISTRFGVPADALASGLDYSGVSLGSPSMESVELPEIALLVDGGVNSYEAGEIWHLFDERMKMRVTLLPVDRVSTRVIDRYNTIIMVHGNYGDLGESGKNALKGWVELGGTLIAVKGGLRYLSGQGFGNFAFENQKKPADTVSSMPYVQLDESLGAQELGGAIFSARIDPTHPLLFGYDQEEIAIFKNDRTFLKKSSNKFANPIVYTSDPLIGGYISAPNLELLKDSPVAGVSRMGSGRIIGLTTDLNFRAFWYGTNRIFLNSVFFGPVVSNRAMR